MIGSIFDRPMFRNPNIRRSTPGGIMASSPELIRVGSAQANPLLSGSANNTFQIPMYKDKAPGLSELLFNPRTFPNVIDSTQKINTGDIEGTRVAEDIKKEREKSNLEKLKEAARRSKIEKGTKVVDTFDPDAAIEGKTKVGAGMDDAEADYFGGDVPLSEAPISKEGSGKADLKPNPNTKTTPEPNVLSGFQSKQKALSDRMQTAVANLSTGLASAEDIKMGGKTVVENTNALVAKMQEKGEEPTLADVQNDAIQLLGFDPKELEGEFEEDRKASIFLNMMKAGLAIAAGESPNAITNIAKGFGVGLQGYGEDVNRLSKNLREDRREARNTMYNLLKDAKSEALAKRTLELQQMEGVVNIQRQLVGDQRTKALDQFNRQITELKFSSDLLSAAASMGFKEKQLEVTKDNVEKTFKAAILRAQPEIISLLKAKGDMKLKEGLTQEILYGEEGYLDQYDLTPKGEKSIEDYLKELKKGSKGGLNTGSKFNVVRENIAKTGQVSIVPKPPGFGDANDDIKNSYGIAGQQLMEELKSLTDPIDRFNRVVSFVRSQKQNFPGISIPEGSLAGDVKKYLQGKKSGGGTNAQDYSDVLELSIGG
jgi:hypothetical protein